MGKCVWRLMARAFKKSAGMEYCNKVKELFECHFIQGTLADGCGADLIRSLTLS